MAQVEFLTASGGVVTVRPAPDPRQVTYELAGKWQITAAAFEYDPVEHKLGGIEPEGPPGQTVTVQKESNSERLGIKFGGSGPGGFGLAVKYATQYNAALRAGIGPFEWEDTPPDTPPPVRYKGLLTRVEGEPVYAVRDVQRYDQANPVRLEFNGSPPPQRKRVTLPHDHSVKAVLRELADFLDSRGVPHDLEYPYGMPDTPEPSEPPEAEAEAEPEEDLEAAVSDVLESEESPEEEAEEAEEEASEEESAHEEEQPESAVPEEEAEEEAEEEEEEDQEDLAARLAELKRQRDSIAAERRQVALLTERLLAARWAAAAAALAIAALHQPPEPADPGLERKASWRWRWAGVRAPQHCSAALRCPDRRQRWIETHLAVLHGARGDPRAAERARREAARAVPGGERRLLRALHGRLGVPLRELRWLEAAVAAAEPLPRPRSPRKRQRQPRSRSNSAPPAPPQPQRSAASSTAGESYGQPRAPPRHPQPAAVLLAVPARPPSPPRPAPWASPQNPPQRAAGCGAGAGAGWVKLRAQHIDAAAAAAKRPPAPPLGSGARCGGTAGSAPNAAGAPPAPAERPQRPLRPPGPRRTVEDAVDDYLYGGMLRADPPLCMLEARCAALQRRVGAPQRLSP